MSLPKKILFLLWMLLLVAAVAEVGLRIRWRLKSGTWDTKEYIDWQYGTYARHPYLRFTLKPEGHFEAGGHDFPINSQGYRGEEPAVPKPEGVYRILCLGGSTTFSVGVVGEYDKAWPPQLQAMLSERHPGKTFEVVNAGVPGWHSADSLLNFHLRLQQLQPDLVIVYHGINDIQAVATPNYQPDYSHQEKLAYADEKAEGVERLFIRSLLYTKLKKKFSGKKSGYNSQVATAVVDEPSAECAVVLERNLRHLVALIRDVGAKPLLATFALSYNLSLPQDKIEEYAGNWAFYAPGLSRAGLARTVDLVNQRVTALGVELGVPVSQNAAALPPGREAFTDLVHFTPAGATLMAETFANTIDAAGLVK